MGRKKCLKGLAQQIASYFSRLSFLQRCGRVAENEGDRRNFTLAASRRKNNYYPRALSTFIKLEVVLSLNIITYNVHSNFDSSALYELLLTFLKAL